MRRAYRSENVVADWAKQHLNNLAAVKVVPGAKRFALYWAFPILSALLTGWIVNLVF